MNANVRKEDFTQRVNFLAELGYYIGIRDPNRLSRYPGNYMVAKKGNAPPSVDFIHEDSYCEVGGDLYLLVRNAADKLDFDHWMYMAWEVRAEQRVTVAARLSQS